MDSLIEEFREQINRLPAKSSRPESIDTSLFLLIHLSDLPSFPTDLAKTGLECKKLLMSSFTSSARSYRLSATFSRHLKTIASASFGNHFAPALNSWGSDFNILSIVPAMLLERNGWLRESISYIVTPRDQIPDFGLIMFLVTCSGEA